MIPEVEKIVETKKQQEKHTEPNTKVSLPPSDPPAALGEPEVQASWGGRSLNVYRREVLYKEVWQFPVVEVAKKYAVSDVTIHKICRSLDIPTPPPGYWAKLRAGKEVSIPPLPKSDRRDVITGSRTQKIYTPSTEEQIQHLSEEDRTAVMAVFKAAASFLTMLHSAHARRTGPGPAVHGALILADPADASGKFQLLGVNKKVAVERKL